MAALRNFNGLASWRNAENSLQSVNLTIPFQVHGADKEGRPVVRKKLRRGQVLVFFAEPSPCLIGLEACASAHYWAREYGRSGTRCD